MLFKVGDNVVHPAYGVGHIIEIEEKQLSDIKESSLYYRSVFDSFSRTSVWIPVETHEVIGLRLVTAKSDLDQYRKLLRSRPKTVVINRSQRATDLSHRLEQGSFQGMCEMVRDLTISKWEKPLVPSDAVTLKQTRELLLQEWAAAAGISLVEATEELRSLLHQDSKQEHS